MIMRVHPKHLCWIALLAVLAGCATPPIRPQIDRAALNAELLQATGRELPALNSAPPAELRLDTRADAIRAAFAYNLQVQVALAELDRAEAERWLAGMPANPMLSLLSLRPAGGGRWELQAGLLGSLYQWTTLAPRRAQADAAVASTRAARVSELLDLAQQASQAHVAAIMSTQQQHIAERQRELTAERLAWARRLQDSGISGSDASLQLESEMANWRLRTLQASAMVATARAGLAAAIGLPSAEGLQLPDDLAPPPLDYLDAEAMRELALARRPELARSLALHDQAQADVLLNEAWGGRIGAAEVGGMAARRSNGLDLLGPSLRIELPIFPQGEARQARAEAGLRGSTATRDATQRRIELQVETLLAELAWAELAHAAAGDRVSRTTELRERAERNYAAGVGDYDALKRLEMAELQAEAARWRSLGELWRAWLALERAVATYLADGAEPQ